MSEIIELTIEEREFLASYLPPLHTGSLVNGNTNGAGESTERELPFVTLTYAQSMDGMISLAPGTRTTLSGRETKSMTHYLRLQHDAILVGVGTAEADDPGLNCRYPGTTVDDQPRPIIVDSTARWDASDSKLLELSTAGQGKAPWVISSVQPRNGDSLTAHGGERLYIRDGNLVNDQPDLAHELSRRPEHFSWANMLKILKAKGINSVMIEGGANVISTLLMLPEVVDVVIITVAPTWLGGGGVDVKPEQRFDGGRRVNAARLCDTKWKQFGADSVLCGKMLH